MLSKVGRRAAAANCEAKMKEIEDNNKKVDDYLTKSLEGTHYGELESRLEAGNNGELPTNSVFKHLENNSGKNTPVLTKQA